jgi:HEPN domain-containing protein
MSDPELGDVLRWLRFATEDLGAARTIYADAHLPHRIVCFHCQQAVEKSLKALLIDRKISFPKTHDLNLLRRLLPDDSLVKQTFADFSGLTVFGTETRYPGDFAEASVSDAKDALDLAERVLQESRADLSKKTDNEGQA